MSNFKSFLLGRERFKIPREIIEIVSKTSAFDSRTEDVNKASALLIFQTQMQQTWLIATSEKLYCILDDIDKGFTRLQWSMPMQNIYRNGEIVANISTSNKSRSTGLLNINNRKNWLYSNHLFSLHSIEDSIADLIKGVQ